MAKRPLIAVPAYRLAGGRVSGWSDAAVATPAAYTEALRRAGGQEAVLMSALTGGADVDELLDRFDGLMLIGGDDVEPERYGVPAGPEVNGVDPERDEIEMALARAAVARGVPTLAICRGQQVLNVALGGTLHQHIVGRPGSVGHGKPGVEPAPELHRVKVAEGSRLAGVLGTIEPVCSSHHHQAIDRLADGLVAVAWSDDGLVEGVEVEDAGWVIGVQWHPEETAATDPVQQRLFDTLVERAGVGCR